MIRVSLPDDTQLEVEKGATIKDVAYEIGPGLGEDAVAGVVNGDLVDLDSKISDGDQVRIVTDESDEYLDIIRHSAAHVFAQALQQRYPEAKLTIGPWTDDGFYYDIYDVDLDGEALDKIEDDAQEIIEKDLKIEKHYRDRDKAFDFYDENPFKQDILETEAADDEEISFYRQGEFEDLCKGPHVESTGEIGAFKLLNISSAYWRGEEDNKSLTRVYGTAFETESGLEDFLTRKEEAEERDHRRIGNEMELFSIPSHSPGGVHYHPNGMVIRRELEEYIRDMNDRLGYKEVNSPELNKTDLWESSGHLEHFKEEGEMFVWNQNDTEYGLKPMNCANHAYIYGYDARSYRDLPLKYSEFGTCHRNEQSGELSGMLRVRAFTQDDGHGFLRPDQIEEEVLNTIEVLEDILTTFDLDITFKLETKPDDAFGDDKAWEQATGALRNALDEGDVDYVVEEGEGAFYGPKIGADATDAIGREWTIGTVQLDFVIPNRLDLTYTNQNGDKATPVMVHRALLGSFERFIGILIEHFKGNFPLWLAPEQVRIIPITENNVEYAKELADELNDIRVSIDDSNRTLDRRIRAVHDDRTPYVIIVGDEEESEKTVSIRDRQERERKDVDRDEFVDHLHDEIEEKSTSLQFLK